MSWVAQDYGEKKDSPAAILGAAATFALIAGITSQKLIIAAFIGGFVLLVGFLSRLSGGTRRVLYDNNGITIEKHKGDSIQIPWQNVIAAKEGTRANMTQTEYTITYTNARGGHSYLLSQNLHFYQLTQQKIHDNKNNQIARGNGEH